MSHLVMDGSCVVGAELFERPVGDVLAAVGAVFGVGVEGEALSAACPGRKMEVGSNAAPSCDTKWPFSSLHLWRIA